MRLKCFSSLAGYGRTILELGNPDALLAILPWQIQQRPRHAVLVKCLWASAARNQLAFAGVGFIPSTTSACVQWAAAHVCLCDPRMQVMIITTTIKRFPA